MEFHCVLQSKGGIGKSLVAAWLAQYLRSTGEDPLLVESDPTNKTVSRYDGLRTHKLDLLDEEQEIDRRRFDELLEVLVQKDERIVVMDNGQGSFTPLGAYLAECDALAFLREHGRATFVHCVVTGGQPGPSTLAGLRALIEDLDPEVPIVVWENEYFGPVDRDEVFELFSDAHERLIGPIRIFGRGRPFRKDTRDMLERYLTFEQALESRGFPLMAKQRLSIVRADIFLEIHNALHVKANGRGRAE